ncbi:MAG: hypothetical protein MZU97_00750 [Bacillus subtilis]|nr:hypothetical protein [Bacillus subtilis]
MLIDGVDIRDIEKHHLRNNIGIILQEPFLFSRTVEENIRHRRSKNGSRSRHGSRENREDPRRHFRL